MLVSRIQERTCVCSVCVTEWESVCVWGGGGGGGGGGGSGIMKANQFNKRLNDETDSEEKKAAKDLSLFWLGHFCSLFGALKITGLAWLVPV